MNQVSSSKNATVLVIVLIIVVLLAVYFYVIQPKKDQVIEIEKTVGILQSEITDLKARIVNTEDELEEESINDFELRKKVPQNRSMMELLQNIEEVEYVSDSRILAINFNNYDTQVAESQLQDPKAQSSDNANNNGEEATTEQQTATENIPVSTIAKESLPTELKMVTFSMDIESPNKAKLKQFIKELETLERVMHIDKIDFSLPGEENDFAEDSSDKVSATIQVTTFYYDGK